MFTVSFDCAFNMGQLSRLPIFGSDGCWFVSSSSVFLFSRLIFFFSQFLLFLLFISIYVYHMPWLEIIKYTSRRKFNIIEISTLVRSRIVYILLLGLFKFQ